MVAARRAYGLTIDRREAAALEGVLNQCENTDMETGGGNCARLEPGANGGTTETLTIPLHLNRHDVDAVILAVAHGRGVMPQQAERYLMLSR